MQLHLGCKRVACEQCEECAGCKGAVYVWHEGCVGAQWRWCGGSLSFVLIDVLVLFVVQVLCYVLVEALSVQQHLQPVKQH